jgi:hypothetical protein
MRRPNRQQTIYPHRNGNVNGNSTRCQKAVKNSRTPDGGSRAKRNCPIAEFATDFVRIRHFAADFIASRSVVEQSIIDPGQFAQVRVGYRLWTTPHQKEECFAAPPARRVAHDVAAPLGRGQGGLRGAQHKAVGPLAD